MRMNDSDQMNPRIQPTIARMIESMKSAKTRRQNPALRKLGAASCGGESGRSGAVVSICVGDRSGSAERQFHARFSPVVEKCNSVFVRCQCLEPRRSILVYGATYSHR